MTNTKVKKPEPIKRDTYEIMGRVVEYTTPASNDIRFVASVDRYDVLSFFLHNRYSRNNKEQQEKLSKAKKTFHDSLHFFSYDEIKNRPRQMLTMVESMSVVHELSGIEQPQKHIHAFSRAIVPEYEPRANNYSVDVYAFTKNPEFVTSIINSDIHYTANSSEYLFYFNTEDELSKFIQLCDDNAIDIRYIGDADTERFNKAVDIVRSLAGSVEKFKATMSKSKKFNTQIAIEVVYDDNVDIKTVSDVLTHYGSSGIINTMLTYTTDPYKHAKAVRWKDRIYVRRFIIKSNYKDTIDILKLYGLELSAIHVTINCLYESELFEELLNYEQL